MQTDIPNLLIAATGEKEPGKGGSGFRKLVLASRMKPDEVGALRANIVGVMCNNPSGGVFTKAEDLVVPFIYSPKGRTGEDYRRIFRESGATHLALSGWLGKVEGLDNETPFNPRVVFNIHPAWDMVKFGGKGFHGHHVHEAVIEAYKRGEVTFSGVTMHFVTAKYDDPAAVFFKRRVPIYPDDTADTLQARVNAMEHKWQAIITDRVVNGKIYWNGRDASSIVGADIE